MCGFDCVPDDEMFPNRRNKRLEKIQMKEEKENIFLENEYKIFDSSRILENVLVMWKRKRNGFFV